MPKSTTKTVTRTLKNGAKVTKTVKSSPWTKSASQRTKTQMAKYNQNTTKSAISEIGKTIRSVAAQTAGTKAYQSTLAAGTMGSQRNSSDNAIALYNQIIRGNPDQEGESGKDSTTEVGGSGSALGG